MDQPIILMYHSIVNEPGQDVPPERETGADIYDLALGRFESHIQFLKNAGYHVGLIEDHKTNDIIITFDDGEMNNYTQALPVLLRANFKAYFFIIVRRVGKPGYMGWDELKKMHEAGMVIGSHGLSHEVLTNLMDTQAEEELRASKQTLEANLGTVINTLSIPRGYCNNKIVRMAHKLGYKHVFISERTRGLTEQCHSRIAVKADWELKRFAIACSGKTPPAEGFSGGVRKAAKFILRESGYNTLRSWIIQLFK